MIDFYLTIVLYLVFRMTENEILDEIDKLRRENGWKPRRRLSQQNKSAGSEGAGAAASGQKHNDSAKSNHHNLSANEQQEKLHQQQVCGNVNKQIRSLDAY